VGGWGGGGSGTRFRYVAQVRVAADGRELAVLRGLGGYIVSPARTPPRPALSRPPSPVQPSLCRTQPSNGGCAVAILLYTPPGPRCAALAAPAQCSHWGGGMVGVAINRSVAGTGYGEPMELGDGRKTYGAPISTPLNPCGHLSLTQTDHLLARCWDQAPSSSHLAPPALLWTSSTLVWSFVPKPYTSPPSPLCCKIV
jgi:hypothetical protein